MSLLSINSFDYSLFQMINNLAHTMPIFNPLMRFLARDGEYVFFAGVIAHWFLHSRDHRPMVVKALIAACVAMGISGLIAHFYFRARPFVTHSVYELIPHAANSSFPSDHATGAFVIAMAFFLVNKKIGTPWLIFAGLVAISRVWTGVHYPFDIIAGACIGIASAVGVQQLFAHSELAMKLLKYVTQFNQMAKLKSGA